MWAYGVNGRFALIETDRPTASAVRCWHDRPLCGGLTLDARTHLVVLPGGEAGLRVGEMMALEWGDVDLVNRQLCVARSDWNGFVTSPKGGRLRRVPLTRRLAAALSAQRHLRSARVLCHDDGTPLTRPFVQARMKRASRRWDDARRA